MDKPEYTIKDYVTEVDPAEFIRDCVDIPRIKGYCEACPNYCRFWSCPEHAFDPLLYWKLFSGITLYGRQIFPARELTEKIMTPAEQAEAIDRIFFKERKAFSVFLREKESELSISLHVGHCDLCGDDNCARVLGLPCRHPKDKRYSVESLGGDVIKAADKYFHIPLCWPKDGRLPDYFMLVGAVLTVDSAASLTAVPAATT